MLDYKKRHPGDGAGVIHLEPFPQWAEFEAFHRDYLERLSKITQERCVTVIWDTGQGKVHELGPVDAMPSGDAERHVEVSNEERDQQEVTRLSAAYPLTVRQMLADGLNWLPTSQIGKWLTSVRHVWLDKAVEPLRAVAVVDLRDSSLDELNKLRAVQVQERDFRFLGGFAVFCGLVHWDRWSLDSSESKDRLTAFKEASPDALKLFIQVLQSLASDRYLFRRLSAQEQHLVPRLPGIIEAVLETVDLIGTDDLRPYGRFRPEAVVRQEVVSEVAELCLACFGQCAPKYLVPLLNGMEIDLPTRPLEWLEKRIRTAHKLVSAYRKTSLLIDPRLPLVFHSDPRWGGYAHSPWLAASKQCVHEAGIEEVRRQ